MCIDIMEIWFGIANGQISSIFDTHLLFSFMDDNLSKHLDLHQMCIDIVEIWFEIANG